MKEMVGGCCVCSDERGWDENPLVYCDGPHCNVAVHQACYGIVKVPPGPWFCRKCETSDRSGSGKLRCELCPSRDGAFKKTDRGSWAHVVCALYIPEVRFENVATMEPIVISLIPPERYNKTCYICEERSDKKESRAMMGACMQCNKPGCKQYFHVTCAQLLGLLCEEAGNTIDNVKYCGYCQYHYSKLKKTSTMKIIPPFKPIPSGNATDSPTSSPEKSSGNVPVSISSSNIQIPVSQCQNPSSLTSDGAVSANANDAIPKTKKSNGKSSSVSSGSSNGSAANNNYTMPRIQIQPSNLFSSTGFMSSSSVLNSNGSTNTNSNIRKSRSKSSSPLTDDQTVSKLETNPNNGAGKLHGGSGKSNDEDSNPVLDASPNPGNPKSNSESSFISSSFGGRNKDLATVSMNEVLSSALDKPMSSTGSKFDRSGSSAALTSGIPEPSFTSSGGNTRMDKPPPDIVPHVTLTPIPMKSSEEAKSDRSSQSKSPGGVSTSFAPPPKLMSESMETAEMATLEKASSPGKRIHTHHFPSPLPYDSDTESATEEWSAGLEGECRSQSNSNSVMLRKEHVSRRDQATRGKDIGQSTRMLTAAQAKEMSLWGAKNAGTKSPTVSLERISLNVSAGKGESGASPCSFPFGSNSTYPAEYSSRKRGPGRPVKAFGGRDEDGARGKGPGGKRGRRGGGSTTSYNRRDPVSNGDGGMVDDNAGDGGDPVSGTNAGSRGGRHTGLPRKSSSTSALASAAVNALQNSPTMSRKGNFEDSGAALTMPQLKAQMAASSASSTPEKTNSMAPHMFGNVLNPASSMAQRMVDTLSQDIETSGTVEESPQDSITASVPPIVGIPFPGKSSIPRTNGTVVSNGAGATAKPQPHTLEELLERQWEQGSQFLMEQAEHLDISQLLSCLNQLKADNQALEDHVASLCQRKEQLTAINARLSIPLGSKNNLGLGLGFGGATTRSDAVAIPTVQSNSAPVPPPAPHPQLHQHIQQQEAVHQGRYSSHKFQGYEPAGHPYQQQHHRAPSGSGTSQMYTYAGTSASGGGQLPHPSSAHHHTFHPHQRDAR